MTDEERKLLRVPLWCPQCQGPMKGKSTFTYYKWGVCQLCHLEFIEDREERWHSGWRPSADEMVAFEKKYYGDSIYASSSLKV